MSCITVIGRRRFWEGGCSEERLPFSSPPWTRSKMRRLVGYATSADPRERAVAAANPKTPYDLMRVLAGDPEVSVRRWVVKNPALPEGLVRYMAEDKDPGVRAYARMVLST